MNFRDLLNEYSSRYYLTYSQSVPEPSWGNKEVALSYLERFSLSEEEYLRDWKGVQSCIFQNENIGLPEIVFKNPYSMLAIRGGVLFVKEDFERLQTCAKAAGDQNILVIQNDFSQQLSGPLFKMKYPIDVSWDELMSGNFISSVIFEMFHNDYFIFGESATWGMYCANDYSPPLNIIGYKSDYSEIFKKQFKRSKEEEEEIKEWLPPKYEHLVKW